MSYTVVFSLKKTGSKVNKVFSAVPNKWVEGNKLYWPKSNLTALLRNRLSEPDIKTWTSSFCSISRANIETYEEALMWEQKFTEIDTEDEENLTFIPPNNPVSNPRYEEMFDSIVTLDEQDHGSYDMSSPSEFLNPIISIECAPNAQKEVTIQCAQCEHRNIKADGIMNRILGEMAAIRIVLERLEINHKTALGITRSVVAAEEEVHLLDKFKFPVNDVSDLRALDAELTTNVEYREFFVNHFGKICGTDGNDKASDKLSIKLASELVFTRKLLTEASWTGISRTSSIEQKFPFRALHGVLSALEEIMRNADNRWNSLDTEKLFRDKLLKHAKKRNAALEKKLQGAGVVVPTSANVDGNVQISSVLTDP